MDKIVYTTLAAFIFTSCGALMTVMSSPAAFQAEELMVEEVQHEMNPQVKPEPQVSQK
jgi:hypothetical protein